MPECEMVNLENDALWEAFKHRFIYDRGVHLLGLGQTESGKTQKAYQIARWLAESGETVAWFDCGKSGEVLPLAGLGFPLHVISPSGCDVTLNNVPVPVSYDHAPSPGKTWDLIKKDHINILAFRAFFRDAISYGAYTSQVLRALENLVYEEDQ